MSHRTLHRNGAVARSFQTNKLVGDETIGEIERQFLQIHDEINSAFVFRIIAAADISHLQTVLYQDSVDVMRAVLHWDIDKFGRYIAHRAVLIDKFLELHTAGDGQVIGCLDDVEVTVHDA